MTKWLGVPYSMSLSGKEIVLITAIRVVVILFGGYIIACIFESILFRRTFLGVYHQVIIGD